MQAIIKASVLDVLKFETSKAGFRETGGILLGFQRSNNIHVVCASGPGANSRSKFNSFEIDGKYAQAFLHKHYTQSMGKVSYLGDWHSHLFKGVYPSYTDRITLEQIALDKEFLTPNPIMVIYRPSLLRGIPALQIAIYLYKHCRIIPLPINIA